MRRARTRSLWLLQGALCCCVQAAACRETTGSRSADGSAAVDAAPSRDGGGAAGDSGSPFDQGFDGGCGYRGTGRVVRLGEAIELCLPATTCAAETCPPPLADCIEGLCVFRGNYQGIATLPEAWATHYCGLASGGCHGVTQINVAEVTAARVGEALDLPLCDGAGSDVARCVGIAASSPMIVGNSQETVDPLTGDPVALWGLGYAEASGLCYELQGPGATVVVALTDRCGGYCSCRGSDYQECGPCVDATDMTPNCPCVGTVPGLFEDCCGRGCSTTLANCDWCASNNHPHFDLDTVAFNRLCGELAANGSCRITRVRPLPCLAPEAGWPPGSGVQCKAGSFWCAGPEPHHQQVPDTSCCCNWDLQPQPDGTCQ